MTEFDLSRIVSIYEGSNGEATKELYAALDATGPVGFVAVNVFRATKSSARAKVYRGGGYRGMAYDKKQWSMQNLCNALMQHGSDLGIRFGWGVDRQAEAVGSPHHHVLYVDLPTGQVSFHNGSRLGGPDYPGQWDGVRGMGPDRICRWAVLLLAAEKVETCAG